MELYVIAAFVALIVTFPVVIISASLSLPRPI